MLRGSEPGDASDVEAEFGSSEYAKEILGQVWGFPPSLELDKEAALQKAIIEMIDCGPGRVGQRLLRRRTGGDAGRVRLRPRHRRPGRP